MRRAHQYKVAALKLLVIVPIFLAASWLAYRFRESPFRPILFALLAAGFWRVGVVMFDHFPREFFKYIAISAAILIVLGFLIWLLRRAAKPGREVLLRRYREAYHQHHCPVCSYPIARGPFKHAVWTRKGPVRLGPEPGPAPEDPVPYACPSCGTRLFEQCESCRRERHTLLPYCESCGQERSIAPQPT